MIRTVNDNFLEEYTDILNEEYFNNIDKEENENTYEQEYDLDDV